MDWTIVEQALADALGPLWPQALAAGFDDGATDFGAPLTWTPVARQAAEDATRALAQDIATMTQTQRDRVAALVSRYSGDRAALVAALRDQDAYIARHAALIAEDQIGRAYNLGKSIAALAAGWGPDERGVDVSDGDGDATCAALNGSRQTVAWALANPKAHPHCRREFSIAPR